MRYRIGIDVGGTFTDCAVVDEKSGSVRTFKVPTTPEDQSRGFIEAVDRCGLPLQEAFLLHGCTVGLNAILTRQGAKIGLITTEGFRDVIAMGHGQRPSAHQFDPQWRRSFGDAGEPFIPRYLRRTVQERMSSSGEELVPLDRDGLINELNFLVRHGVEAVVICFINSYANNAHEQQARAVVRELYPNLYCWTSTEVHPCFKEYPRFSTAVLNTYVGPLIDRYLCRVEQLLGQRGYHTELMVMQSNGGVLPATMARERPAYTLQSGPVGGVVGAQYWSKRLGVNRMITLDVGGTSADYSIIQDGQPFVTTELALDHEVFVALPAVKVHSIGAGGGSIAWIDHLGALRVGPTSAGANPGPACYGRGGSKATVTDALVVAGILRPEYFLGGEAVLIPHLALEALDPIAQALDLTPEQAAEAILNVAVANMVEGAREVSVYNGIDPRDFVLYAFGAAGPIFASRIGRELGVRHVLIPPYPGEMCAFGLAMADLRLDLGLPLVRSLDETSPDEFNRLFQQMEEHSIRVFGRQGLPTDRLQVLRWLDGRYEGQTWETSSVPVPPGPLNDTALKTVLENFHETHRKLWGNALPHFPVKVTMVRITALLPIEKVEPRPPARADSRAPAVGEAKIFMEGTWTNVPVYSRDALSPGTKFNGPALIQQPTSTTLLQAGDMAQVDATGHIWIRWE